MDESNFFGADLVDIANQLAGTGKQVIIAGLDTDYMGRPFQVVGALIQDGQVIRRLDPLYREQH